MKTFFIPAGILAAILIFSLWTGYYVDERLAHWDELLEEVDAAVLREDWTAVSEHLERAYEDWEGRQTFLHVIMEHEELDKAEELFAGAFAMCGEEGGSGFRALLAQLMSQLEALAETQSLGIKNIL